MLKLVTWKISLKNGNSLDLNVVDGDKYDKGLRKWVDGMSKKQRKYFCDKFDQGEIWLSPDEFSMALRTPVPEQPPIEKFQKLEDEADLPPKPL